VSPPRPHWGAYLQRSPDPLADLRGPASKGEGKGKEGERERRREEGKGRDRPPFRKFLDPPLDT